MKTFKEFIMLNEAKSIKVKGIRELKKYIGKGYKVTYAEAWTKARYEVVPGIPNQQGIGVMQANADSSMRENKVKSYSIEKALEWREIEISEFGSKKSWEWFFTLEKGKPDEIKVSVKEIHPLEKVITDNFKKYKQYIKPYFFEVLSDKLDNNNMEGVKATLITLSREIPGYTLKPFGKDAVNIQKAIDKTLKAL